MKGLTEPLTRKKKIRLRDTSYPTVVLNNSYNSNPETTDVISSMWRKKIIIEKQQEKVPSTPKFLTLHTNIQ